MVETLETDGTTKETSEETIKIGEEQVLSFLKCNNFYWRGAGFFLSFQSIGQNTQLLQVVVNGERIDGASVNEEVQVEFPQDLILRRFSELLSLIAS